MRDLDNSPVGQDVAETGPTADLAAMRVDYGAARFGDDQNADLDETWLANGWEPLLRRWIDEATSAEVAEPNAIVLATVSLASGSPRPVARTVLCKGLSSEGVIFYTNFDSAKGDQLAEVPFAAATFLWAALARQVHVRGPVERVPIEVTTEYWRSRPRSSRLGAWASQQSRPVGSRAEMDRTLAETTARFAEVDDIPVPPNWGGYLLRPDEVEFWQGRRSRLHNRIRLRIADGAHTIERLQP